MNEDPRVERLKRAAAKRTESALKKVRATVREMRKRDIEINFRSVHRESGVSLDFLYRNEEARHLIERHRRRAPASLAVAEPAGGHAGTVEMVLAERLRSLEMRHRQEMQSLRDQLAVARGEVVALRQALRHRGGPDHQQ